MYRIIQFSYIDAVIIKVLQGREGKKKKIVSLVLQITAEKARSLNKSLTLEIAANFGSLL